MSENIRVYDPVTSAVFMKTKDKYGGLSNMGAGYPMAINGIMIRTSEAIYQASRFPHLPDIQRKIIDMASPMAAKMCARSFVDQSRQDWFSVNISIMRWCLRVKLAQNWKTYGGLLLSTGDLPIVEKSFKDTFWGARPMPDGTLRGRNILGRLSMELRELLREDSQSLQLVRPLEIPDWLLFGIPIETIYAESFSVN